MNILRRVSRKNYLPLFGIFVVLIAIVAVFELVPLAPSLSSEEGFTVQMQTVFADHGGDGWSGCCDSYSTPDSYSSPSSYETPYSTPYETPYSTPYGTPYATPSVTPSCTIYANPTTVQYAGSTTLTWTSTNATTATLTGIGSVNTNGSHLASGIVTTTTYILTVTGPGGTVNCQTIVTVTQPQTPSCAIAANPTTIQYGGSSVLTWSSTNATSASLNQGIGSVTTSGSRSVSPLITTTYILTVTGPGGTAICETIVVVQQQQVPACSIYANPTSIQQGGSSTLTWTSTNATTASLSSVGSVGLNGSTSVSPSVTTTYILTVTGPGGTVNCQTTIIVQQQQTPSCTIYANPSNVQYGGSSTLTWSSTNATAASLNQGIGSVAVNGSYAVGNIYSTTTYILTITGPGGTVNCQTTVTTNTQTQNPWCTISANPTSIQNGGSSYLSWSSSNATSANLSTVGSVGVNGNYTVYPQVTTTYVLTVYGSQGQTAQCQTSVSVNTVYQQAPSCWITLTPQYGYNTSYNNYNQQGTLTWGSNNATSAFIAPNVGSISTSGSRLVPISGVSIYTMTVYGTGGTATCQTQAQVIPPTYYPPQISLTQIPYTGFDLGDAGTALYFLSIVSFALASLYLLVYYKGGMKVFANNMFRILPIARRAR